MKFKMRYVFGFVLLLSCGLPLWAEDPNRAIWNLSYSYRGNFLAANYGGSTVQIWRTPDLKVLTTRNLYQLRGVWFSPKKDLLLTENWIKDGTNRLTLWEVQKDGELKEIQKTDQNHGRLIEWSSNGRLLVFQEWNTIQVWDIEKWKPIVRIHETQLANNLRHRVVNGSQEIEAVHFMPSGKELVIAISGVRPYFVFWDISTDKATRVLNASVDDPTKFFSLSLPLHPPMDRPYLFGGGGALDFWSLSNGVKIDHILFPKGLERKYWNVQPTPVFTPDTNLFLVHYVSYGGGMGETELRESLTGEVIRVFDFFKSFEISPHNDVLALSGGQSPKIFEFNPLTIAKKQPVPFNEEKVREDINRLTVRAPSEAYKAMERIIAQGDATIPILGEILQLPNPPAKEEISQAIDDLDARPYRDREAADRKLVGFGAPSYTALTDALNNPKSAEQRRRLISIVGQITASRNDPRVTDPTQLAKLRVLVLLEYLGTAQARQLLGRIATRARSFRLAWGARETLNRLAKE